MKDFDTEGVKPATERFGGGEGVHNHDVTLGLGLYLDESYGDSLSLPFGFSMFSKNVESKHHQGLFTEFKMTTIHLSTKTCEKPGSKYTYEPNGATSQYVSLYPNEPGSYYLSGSIRNHSCNKTVECDTCDGTGICQKCDGRGYNMCRKCDGTGKVDELCGFTKNGKPKYRKVACPRCHGSKKILCSSCGGTKKCSSCSGSGKVTCERCGGTGNYQTYDVVTYKFGSATLTCSCFSAPSNIGVRIPESVIDNRDLICEWHLKNYRYSDSKAIRSREYQTELCKKLEANGFTNPGGWSKWVGDNLCKKEKEFFDNGELSAEMSAKSYGCPITCYKYKFEGKEYATYVVGRRPKELYGTFPTAYFWENYKLKTSFLSKVKFGISSNVSSMFQSKEKYLSNIRQSLVLLAARMMLKSPNPVSLDKFYALFKLNANELDVVKSIDVENMADKDFYKRLSNLRRCPAVAVWAYTYSHNDLCYRDAAINLDIDDNELFEKIEAWYSGPGFRNYGESYVLDWFVSKISKKS